MDIGKVKELLTSKKADRRADPMGDSCCRDSLLRPGTPYANIPGRLVWTCDACGRRWTKDPSQESPTTKTKEFWEALLGDNKKFFMDIGLMDSEYRIINNKRRTKNAPGNDRRNDV